MNKSVLVSGGTRGIGEAMQRLRKMSFYDIKDTRDIINDWEINDGFRINV